MKKSKHPQKVHTSKKKVSGVTWVLVVLVIIIMAAILLKPGKDTMNAEQISSRIINNPQLSLVKNNEINEYRLQQLRQMDYDQLKKSIDTENDFCISVVDEKGKPVLEKGSPELNKQGACR